MGLFRKKEDYYYDGDYVETEYEKNDSNDKINKIINIIFTIIFILILMIAIDVVGVSRYNVGPFFTIKTHTYKDGGTKEYYGLGYKVIKYHQIQGRRDKAIGSWDLKYNIEPINYNYIDLAINLTNNPEQTYNTIGNKFIRITGILSKKNKKQIIISYKDKDTNKYNLNIICNMENNKNINKLKINKKITVIGTVKEYKLSDTKTNKLYINNCFAK